MQVPVAREPRKRQAVAPRPRRDACVENDRQNGTRPSPSSPGYRARPVTPPRAFAPKASCGRRPSTSVRSRHASGIRAGRPSVLRPGTPMPSPARPQAHAHHVQRPDLVVPQSRRAHRSRLRAAEARLAAGPTATRSRCRPCCRQQQGEVLTHRPTMLSGFCAAHSGGAPRAGVR